MSQYLSLFKSKFDHLPTLRLWAGHLTSEPLFPHLCNEANDHLPLRADSGLEMVHVEFLGDYQLLKGRDHVCLVFLIAKYVAFDWVGSGNGSGAKNGPDHSGALR